jgi:hypothetical protein
MNERCLGDWVVYKPGDSLYCPGTYHPGDRRKGPCRRNWGRATAETWMRVKRMGQEPAPPVVFISSHCTECQRPIEASMRARADLT